MALSKQERKIFLEGLSCKNCTEKKRCKEQKDANRKLLDYFFATITEANCFDERFIQEFKNAIPSITRCDVAYEKLLEKLKESRVMYNMISPKDLEDIKNGNVPSTHYQDNTEYQPKQNNK